MSGILFVLLEDQNTLVYLTVRDIPYLTNDSQFGYSLFGTNKGTIKNVGVVDTYFQAMSSVGAICAINLGTIDNCFSLCTLNADYNVGGICGQNFGKVNNCFSAGKLLIENYSSNYGGICCNFYTNHEGTTYTPVVTNSYYLSGMAPSAVYGETDTENVEGKTTAQFKSGEVCYLLNDSKADGTPAWYQNLSAEDGDAYPVLTNTGMNTVYYGYEHGSADPKYTNSAHAHAYAPSAADEANGNHDKSYQGDFNWADNDDKTNATVTATFTCSVCQKVETPTVAVVKDISNSKLATCTEDGSNIYTASHSFTGNTFTDTYIQTITALGHDMTETATFNSEKHIYQKGCQREG